jgi:hypothetical protein
VSLVREQPGARRGVSRTAWARATRALALVVVSLVGCCSPGRIPPPQSPVPRAGHPADAIPADLDVVVRLDLQAMRDVLGPSATELLTRQGPVRQDARDFAVSWAMSRADTVWLAIRPGFAADLTDNVIVLRGRLSGVERHLSASWGSAADLGGGWFRYERLRRGARSAPARLYFHVDDLLVVVSTAEIDSTERALERGILDRKPRPPDKGTVSAAARLPPIARLIEARSPRAAELLRQGSELTATASLNGAGLAAELEVHFDLEEDAQQAVEATRLLLRAIESAGAFARPWAEGVRIEAIGTRVVIHVSVPAHVLRGLLSRTGPAQPNPTNGLAWGERTGPGS